MATSHHEDRDGLLRQLVEEYYVRVYRFAYRLAGTSSDAEDVTQQTFLQAQRKLDQLRDRAQARSWLFTIARNVFLKTRSGASKNGVSLEAVAEPCEDWAETEFDEEALQRALQQLGEEFRSVILMFYFREFSYKEIAEALDIPMGTVMSRLSRAKQLLRRALGAENTLVANRSGRTLAESRVEPSAREDVS